MKPQLLIVDDDRSLLQMLIWDFEQKGYEVTPTASCKEAIAAVNGTVFDFALLDYHLPDGNGLELIERLRLSCPEIAVVLCSGMVDDVVVMSAQGKEGFYFFRKPLRLHVLHGLFRAATVSRH